MPCRALVDEGISTSTRNRWHQASRGDVLPETLDSQPLAASGEAARRGASRGQPEEPRPSEAKGLAPRAGLEPATLRLTAGCSAIELPRNARREARTKDQY